MKKTDKFTLFWNGVFSNWYPCKFTLDGEEFNCSEQYMMWKKAKTFNDEEIAQLILEASHPREQKELGRKVKNFNSSKWDSICKKIVYDGCHAKFTQNVHLLKALMETGETELVEASPYDLVWGIGLGEDDPKALDKANWLGKNYLGEVLTKLRNDLKNK